MNCDILRSEMTPSTPSDRLTPQHDRDSQGRLLISCPDGPGIVAAISTFLAATGANILTSDQYTTDPEGGIFFMRMAFRLDGLMTMREEFEARFAAEVAARFDMTWRCAYDASAKRLALFASREEHCLLDMLWRWRRGDLEGEIVQVVSNHRDLEADVNSFGVPFAHIPVTRETKAAAEAQALELLAGKVDVIVLARYMQILSSSFLETVGVPIINIHHSFLPAFVGADPYRQAHDHGVKIIGATAHYVTDKLDEGPIIDQDIVRVSHRDNVAALARIGADVERIVLARAVTSHLEDRVIVHENRTFVF
jgi:formyltetrahydrofolate deformylase